MKSNATRLPRRLLHCGGALLRRLRNGIRGGIRRFLSMACAIIGIGRGAR